MFGGFGNMMNLLKNAKDIQARVEAMQQDLLRRRFDAETGGGAVHVTVDGKGMLVNVKIDPAAAGDVELLEDLIVSAANLAAQRSQEAAKQELSKLTGGLNLPGLSEMFQSQSG